MTYSMGRDKEIYLAMLGNKTNKWPQASLRKKIYIYRSTIFSIERNYLDTLSALK